MYFDRAMNLKGASIGVFLILPMGDWIPIAKRLDFEVTNNILEYKACVCGFKALIAIGIKKADMLGDSKLVIS